MHNITKLFTDKHGKQTFFQKPNAALATGLIATILQHFLPYGQLNFIVGLIAFGTLFTWAWLEMLYGDSVFRHVFGLGMLVWFISSRI